MGIPPSPMYCEGTILRLQSHRPPEPFGHPYYKQEETPGIARIENKDLSKFCPQDYVFARHPRERCEPSIFELPLWYEDGQALTLEVQSVISSTSTRGAQTVLCRIHGEAPKVWENMGHESTPVYVTARIFDPLHYDGHDLVYQADYEYAGEAASYYQIHARRDHPVFKDRPDIVPKFYGTWSTTLWRNSKPTKSITRSKLQSYFRSVTHGHLNGRVKYQADGNPKSLIVQGYRPIRIVLTEYLSSLTMNTLCWDMPSPDFESKTFVKPNKYRFKSEEDSLDMFAQVLDNSLRLLNVGIFMRGVDLEFVTVTDDNKAAITDFSQACVTPYTDIGWHVHEFLSKPNHPSYWIRIRDYAQFSGWFPPGWLSKHGGLEFASWALEKFPMKNYTSPREYNQTRKDSGWDGMMRYHKDKRSR